MEHDHAAPPVSERAQYTRGNTQGKVIRILCGALYDCPDSPTRTESYRRKYSLPSLAKRMTVQEWDAATKNAAKGDGVSGGGEGIPNILLTELAAYRFIEFVDA